jgi:hypothetical protein
LCNVCLSYLSVPVFSFSIPKAGDFIDISAANARGESATRIRAIKEESFCFNGHFASKTHQAIGEYYDEMIQALVAAIRDTLASVQSMPKLNRPIPLVLAGGSVLVSGFRDRFEKQLRETELPVAIAEVRLAPNPQHSTARGALGAAMSETYTAGAAEAALVDSMSRSRNSGSSTRQIGPRHLSALPLVRNIHTDSLPRTLKNNALPPCLLGAILTRAKARISSVRIFSRSGPTAISSRWLVTA